MKLKIAVKVKVFQTNLMESEMFQDFDSAGVGRAEEREQMQDASFSRQNRAVRSTFCVNVANRIVNCIEMSFWPNSRRRKPLRGMHP